MFNDINNQRVSFMLSGDDESHVLNTLKRFEVVRRDRRHMFRRWFVDPDTEAMPDHEPRVGTYEESSLRTRQMMYSLLHSE
jgi:hypothetical protein